MSALDSIYSKATNLPAFATFKSTIVIFFGICKNFQWFFSALTASYFKFWWGKSLMKRSWVDQKNSFNITSLLWYVLQFCPAECCVSYKNQSFFQRQPSRGVLRKRCSENNHQIYRRKPTPKCDFNKLLCFALFSCKFTVYFQNTFFLRTLLEDCFCLLFIFETKHWTEGTKFKL